MSQSYFSFLFRFARAMCAPMCAPMLLALSVALSGSAALASFAVMPMQAHMKMPREGNRVLGEIQVFNSSATILHIDTSFADWHLTPEGQPVFSQPIAAGESAISPSSCASWITVSPAEFTLAPKKTVRVRYAVTSPVAEALSGERRAIIFFQSRPVPLKGTERLGLQVSMRIGYKLFVSSPGAPPPAAKVIDMVWQAAPKGRLGVRLQNKGATTLRATGTMQVRDQAGKVVAKGDLLPAQVLPQSERCLWFTPAAPLAPGSYTFHTLVNYGAKALLGGQLSVAVNAPPVTPAPAEGTPPALAVGAPGAQPAQDADAPQPVAARAAPQNAPSIPADG